jgi:microcystin-dependent protein
MTVASTLSKVQLTSTGGTEFPFSYKCLDSADLEVYVGDDIQTLNSDYSVTLADDYNSGTVTFTSAVTSGEVVTIARVMDLTQGVDLQNQGNFYAETHEQAFDRLTLLMQQQQEEIDRKVGQSVTDTTDPNEYLESCQDAQEGAETAQTAASNSASAAASSASEAEASAIDAALAASNVVTFLYEFSATTDFEYILIPDWYFDAETGNLEVFISGVRQQNGSLTFVDDEGTEVTSGQCNRIQLGGTVTASAEDPIPVSVRSSSTGVVGDVWPEAAHATTADGLTDASVLMPTGAVLPFAMSSPPTGWLKCNGDAVSRTTYSTLFAAIGTTHGDGDGATTFTLPDLRGEFVRGLDDSRGVDTGRALGSTQGDSNKSHTHGFSGSTNTTGAHSHSVQTYTGTGGLGHLVEQDTADTSTGFHNTSSAGNHDHTFSGTTGASGNTETRPRNVALLYCIKY